MTGFGTSRFAVANLRVSRSSTIWYSAESSVYDAVLRVARAAREIRALGMHAGQRAIRNAVAVHVEIAMEFLELGDFFLAVAPCRDRERSCRPI